MGVITKDLSRVCVCVCVSAEHVGLNVCTEWDCVSM